MNAGWLPFCGDGVEKFVGGRGIGSGGIEGDVVVANVGGFRGSALCFEIRAWLAGLPQIDDRCETQLLDFRYSLGFGGTGTGDRGFEAIQISIAGS